MIYRGVCKLPSELLSAAATAAAAAAAEARTLTRVVAERVHKRTLCAYEAPDTFPVYGRHLDAYYSS